MRLQLGLVGYGQWQTTDKSGPTITPKQATAHYKVNALGFASNVMLPERKVSVGVKYFKEFRMQIYVPGIHTPDLRRDNVLSRMPGPVQSWPQLVIRRVGQDGRRIVLQRADSIMSRLLHIAKSLPG